MAMNRVRTLVGMFALALMLGLAPGALAQESPPGDQPPVVVDGAAVVPTEEAWTFRFLIPTVLVASGLIVAATVVGYGVRVRGRYRVVR